MFCNGDRIKFAAWTTTDSHEIDLGPDLTSSKIVSQSGAILSGPDDSRITISDEPLYLTMDAPYPSWLRLLAKASRFTEAEARSIAESILQRLPGAGYAEDLWDAIENGSIKEKQTAFQISIRLANTIQSNRSLAIQLYHLVLDKDTNPLNRKQAVVGLSRTGSPESLDKVAPLLRDPDLMEAAAEYYLHVAFTFAKANDPRARELLQEAVKLSQKRYLVERVLSEMEEAGNEIDKQSLSALSKSAGFINKWWVAGPFPNDGESGAYFPESGIDFTQTANFDTVTAKWRQIQLDGIYAIIPFADLFGRKQLTAYAYTEINMPEKKTALFKIGSNDGVVCWLNGKKIHENPISRGLTIDEDSINAHLEKGVNRILLKVYNEGNAWEACLRICETRGIPLDLN